MSVANHQRDLTSSKWKSSGMYQAREQIYPKKATLEEPSNLDRAEPVLPSSPCGVDMQEKKNRQKAREQEKFRSKEEIVMKKMGKDKGEDKDR
ncbi:hypothetical protein N7523_001276 [Penicillium sp. IBT 18751x]|nr:hypothetical protein N7523_001276 [Penicillium sp. IBT 18751x]